MKEQFQVDSQEMYVECGGWDSKNGWVLGHWVLFSSGALDSRESPGMSLALVIYGMWDKPLRSDQNLGQPQNLPVPGQIWTVSLHHLILLPVLF